MVAWIRGVSLFETLIRGKVLKGFSLSVLVWLWHSSPKAVLWCCKPTSSNFAHTVRLRKGTQNYANHLLNICWIFPVHALPLLSGWNWLKLANDTRENWWSTDQSCRKRPDKTLQTISKNQRTPSAISPRPFKNTSRDLLKNIRRAAQLLHFRAQALDVLLQHLDARARVVDAALVQNKHLLPLGGSPKSLIGCCYVVVLSF